ncbi:hypothetical protein, partial [Paenibacillus shirakamiensis]|uniref:hypothetical protein n=1 Tax=Paenibacillus shirakamiensis TaxID=1265935 RepID=UPI001AE8FB8C
LLQRRRRFNQVFELLILKLTRIASLKMNVDPIEIVSRSYVLLTRCSVFKDQFHLDLSFACLSSDPYNISQLVFSSQAFFSTHISLCCPNDLSRLRSDL